MGIATESIYENSSTFSAVGVTWVDMQNYRSPPPYPGHSKQVYTNQPGYRQSYSGSETSTDVSLSSTENLATSQRQDPQGEETQSSPFHHHHHQHQIPHHLLYQHHHQQQQQLHQQQQHQQSVEFGALDDGLSSYSIMARLGMPPGGFESSGKYIDSGGPDVPSSLRSQYASSSAQYHQQSAGQCQHQRQSDFYSKQHTLTMASSSGVTVTTASSLPFHPKDHLEVPHWYPKPNEGSYTPRPLDSQYHPHPHQHLHSASPPSSRFSSSTPSLQSSITCLAGNTSMHALVSKSAHDGSGYLNTMSSRLNQSSHLIGKTCSSISSNLASPQFFSSSSTSTPSVHPSAKPALTSSLSSSLNVLSTSSSHSNQTTVDYPSRTNPGHSPNCTRPPRAPQVPTFHHHHHPYVNTHYHAGDLAKSEGRVSLSPRDFRKEHYSNSNNNPHLGGSTEKNKQGVQRSSSQEKANLMSISTLSSTVLTSSASSSSLLSSSSSSTEATSSSMPAHFPPPPDYPGNRLVKSSNSSSSSSFLPSHTDLALPVALASSAKSCGAGDIRASRSYEMVDRVVNRLGTETGGRSNPDIRLCASNTGICGVLSSSDLGRSLAFHGSSPARSSNTSCSEDSDHQAALLSSKADCILDMVTEENRTLRKELAAATVKVSKLLKFEMEVEKMHDAHEGLLQSHQKREALWLAMKRKLEERVRSLESALDDGGIGSGGITDVQRQSNESLAETEWRNKMAEKDSLISRLIAQNQELSSSCKQVEAENAQLSVSLAEQKAHVDIVEKALVNTQARVIMLDGEYQNKDLNTQNADGSLSASSASSIHLPTTERLSADHDRPTLSGEMREENTEVKQKCVTERDLRLDETSKSLKQVKKAAFEKSSSDMEKLIDEAKTDKLKHIEEMHEGNKKLAEMEATVKKLRTQIVEKEAMLKFFHRSSRAMLPRSSSMHALCHSPRHSPQPSIVTSAALDGSASSSIASFSASTTTFIGSGGHREFSSVLHKKTESTSAIDQGRKSSLGDDILAKVQALNIETEDDAQEAVKLWHV